MSPRLAQAAKMAGVGEHLSLCFDELLQDFEREADYMGIYMMERSGIDSSEVGDLWRKMAVENVASISFGRSHPTTAERFVNLDAYSKEARQKRQIGEALLPKRE